MLTTDSPNTPTEQPNSDGDNFQAAEDLGTHIDRIAALLRAAINADIKDDAGWLVSMAQDEAEKAEARYLAWGLAPRGEGK